MSHLNKNPQFLKAPKNVNRAALRPLRIGSSSRPGSAKQWFEACNERKNEEAWRLENLKSAVSENKKREWQTKFYNSLVDSKNNNSWEAELKVNQEKENRILARRSRLHKLFKEDEEKYEKERETKFTRRPESICDSQAVYPEVEMLKKYLDDLKRKNEEERHKISEKLSYEVWRKNQAEIRQVESKRLNDFVREAWVDQAQWKEDQRRKLEEERIKAEIEAEQMKQKKEQEEAKMEKEREERHEKWKVELNQQLNMIREREEKEINLKNQEEILQREKSKLEELIQKRESFTEARKRKDLELFWARQHQLKLKKKAIIIQDELIQDQFLIEDFLKGLSRSSICDDLVQKKEEAEWMRSVLEEQKRLEKLREKEYELLFSEEARQMWDQRQSEWDKEQKARDCLMRDVFLGLQKQIDDKIQAIANSIGNTKEERFSLISDMKQTQHLLELEEKERKEELMCKQPQTYQNSTEAVTRSSKYERLMQEKYVTDHKKEIARLEDEMKKLWQSSYVPPRHGRKKVAW